MTKQGMAEQDEGVASLHAKTNSDQSHFPLGPNQAFLSTIPAEHAVGDVDPSRQYEPAKKIMKNRTIKVDLCLPH
jgi:hypothetical protein